MTKLPYSEGQSYLLSSVVKDGKADYASKGHIIVNTEPRNGVSYRAVFMQGGESPNGKVVICTLCRPISDYGTIDSQV